MKKCTILAMFIALVSSFSVQANEIVINRMHIWKNGVATSYLIEADLDSITFSQEIIQDDETNLPEVADPGAGKTTVVLYVPEDTPAGCYAVGPINGWNVQNTQFMFSAVATATNPRWVAYTFDWTEDLTIKVLAIPSDPTVALSWNFQWAKNRDPENDLTEDNVVILQGEGMFELENQGQPQLVGLADGGVCYIHVKAWANTPVIKHVPCETAAFKHPWGGGEWVYREAIKTAEATFELNARYGNTGFCVANDVNGFGENWYPESDIAFVGDVAEGDSVNVKFVSEKGTVGELTVTLIEKAGPVDQPEGKDITVKAKVPAAWTNVITAWVWPTNGEGKEVYPSKEGDWYVVTEHCVELNLIIKNGEGWDGYGRQEASVDITGLTADLTCLELASDGANKATYTIVDCEVDIEEPTDPYNGHEYVDLGLPSGLKWATCNVGANAPEEYGDYFAWGETQPKETYDWSTYKWCNGSENTMTKYCTNSSYGTVDNKTVLDKEDDAASVNWGGAWRMPTDAEMTELREQCTLTWTTQNGVNGCKVTSKKNGNSIFLPVAGVNAYGSCYYAGTEGFYWSSTLGTGDLTFAYSVHVYGSIVDRYRNLRCYGLSIRPVCDEQSESPSEPESPSDGIGVFSVSADKQVTFSPGNLQYTQSTNTWSFASAQWEVLGFDNVTGGSVFLDTVWGEGKNGTALADKIDLFGWGTGNAPTKSSIVNSDYLTFVDWGTNQIGNDTPNTWRTLSKDEWVYIFYNRENAQSLFALGSVNGVNGTIILPDNWTTPAGVSFVASTTKGLYWNGSNYYNDNEDNYSHNTYTSEQWSKMEQAGAVFLPVNGDRWGTDVWNAGSVGYYWSSTACNNNDSYTVYFLRHFLDPHYDNSTNTYGCSVRLVKDVEGESDTPTTPNNPEEPTDPDETEGANDYMLDNFKIGGYALFELGDPIAGTDTLLTLSTGEEVTCQLAPSIAYVWDDGITLGNSGLTGAGYIFSVENYVYAITDSPNGIYNRYFIVGNAISGFDLAVDTIASEDILPYTGKAGQLLDVDMYGDAWASLYNIAEDTIDEEHYNAIMDKYYAAQTGTQFYYYDFNTEAQIIYSGNVSYLYLKEDNQTGELYYDLKLEWYDNVNEGRSYGLLAETEVNEEGEKIITGIVKPYDMRFIHKHYQQLPSTEKDPTEAPARVQAKAKSAQYTIFNPELSLDRIPQLPSLKKIK